MLRQLKPAQLCELQKYIKEVSPNEIKDIADGKYQIKLDAMSAENFRKIENKLLYFL